MKHLLASASLLLCVFCNQAYAAWSTPGTTSGFRIYNGTTVLARLSSLSEADNLAACGNANSPGQFSFPVGQVYTDALISMILTAEMGGRSIKVFLTGACVLDRPEINGVELVD